LNTHNQDDPRVFSTARAIMAGGKKKGLDGQFLPAISQILVQKRVSESECHAIGQLHP
jgi:hypothetical protein